LTQSPYDPNKKLKELDPDKNKADVERDIAEENYHREHREHRDPKDNEGGFK